jgi:hypothetical protein
MSRVMRQVLVDHTPARLDAKRGGEARVSWDERSEPSLGQIVEMHYFGGMTAEEVAAAVDRSVHGVRHDIRLVRAWLRCELAR